MNHDGVRVAADYQPMLTQHGPNAGSGRHAGAGKGVHDNIPWLREAQDKLEDEGQRLLFGPQPRPRPVATTTDDLVVVRRTNVINEVVVSRVLRWHNVPRAIVDLNKRFFRRGTAASGVHDKIRLVGQVR